MEDRELLELAAKAAGIKLEYCEASGFHWIDNKYTGLWWDPINVDGDALRLAIKLRLDLTFYNGFQEIHAEPSNGDGLSASVEDYGDDVDGAVRRAIVRAAAEIGKSMQELTK